MGDPARSAPKDANPTAALEAEVDEAIATCGGDARTAVRTLLVANAHLDSENEMLQQAVSAGFSRRKVRPRPKLEVPDKQLDL